jgi:putative heme-binding domain-containing protein
VSWLDPLLPTGRTAVDTELVSLLAYLGSPTVVAKTLTLIAALPPTPVPDWSARIARNDRYGKAVAPMLANMPPAQGIRYAYALRTVAHGWTLDQRRRFFTFIAAASRHPGGASFTGYLKNLRTEALATCSVEERRALADLTGETLGPVETIDPIAPSGPGREWTVQEAVKALAGTSGTPDIRHGRGLYQAIGCAACHRLAGQGGDVGPDLSSVGGKFAQEALLTSIIEPSRDLNDQYGAIDVTLTDGTVHAGRVGDSGAGEIFVYPFAPGAEPITIPRAKVKSIVPSTVSPMPPGMLNGLNPAELRDVLAFLLSTGETPSKKKPQAK